MTAQKNDPTLDVNDELSQATAEIHRAQNLQRMKDELLAEFKGSLVASQDESTIKPEQRRQQPIGAITKQQTEALRQLVDDQIRDGILSDTSQDHNAVNDFSEPIVAPAEAIGAKQYGYSFNSKKMAQGPTFFNLRIMCHCLGSAIKRHIEFSRNTFWFLDELNEAKDNERAFGLDAEDVADLEMSGFSYNLPDDLKIPTDGKKQEARDEYKRREK